MNIEQAFIMYLSQCDELQKLISNRIYPLKYPMNAQYPCITYKKISGLRHHDIDVAMPVFEFSVWVKEKENMRAYGLAREIAQQLRFALNGVKTVINGMPIVQVVFLNEYDLFENDTGVYRIAMEFKIIYRSSWKEKYFIQGQYPADIKINV